MEASVTCQSPFMRLASGAARAGKNFRAAFGKHPWRSGPPGAHLRPSNRRRKTPSTRRISKGLQRDRQSCRATWSPAISCGRRDDHTRRALFGSARRASCSGLCGRTKRSGQMMCGAASRRTSRSINASRTRTELVIFEIAQAAVDQLGAGGMRCGLRGRPARKGAP